MNIEQLEAIVNQVFGEAIKSPCTFNVQVVPEEQRIYVLIKNGCNKVKHWFHKDQLNVEEIMIKMAKRAIIILDK